MKYFGFGCEWRCIVLEDLSIKLLSCIKFLLKKKKWIGEKRFLHALNYCMLLPRPEAQQLAIYIGWLLHRYRGGLVAGILFVLPGDITMIALSILYATYHTLGFIQILFFGIKAAVIAIVFDALIRIGKKALKNLTNLLIALGAFIGIFFLSISFSIIIFSAALLGFLLDRYGKIQVSEDYKSKDRSENDIVSKNTYITSYSIKNTLFISGLWLFIWLAPLLLCLLILGTSSTTVVI